MFLISVVFSRMAPSQKALALTLALSAPFAACSKPTTDQSRPFVTSVDHTIVKRQSIGNCWLYAQATWLESLILTESGESVDVSESYWTWWNWYNSVVGSTVTEVSTGGWWSQSAAIILAHGWVLEKEFLPFEENTEMSYSQASALSYMNSQLQEGGALATQASRTPANVRAQLDLAFASHMADTEALARPAADTDVGKLGDAQTISLADALNGASDTRWAAVSFPRLYGATSTPTAAMTQRRHDLLVRVQKALNDHQPVVMSLMIDFNALDLADQTFKASTLAAAGGPGHQGGHMVVLNDYTVRNAPGFGDIGEGDVSDEMKEAALAGDLILFKAKNSWGKNRPDRGLTDGFTRFDMAYLTGQLEWKSDEAGTSTSFYTTLTDFVLPPGY